MTPQNTNKLSRRCCRLISTAAILLATTPMLALAGGGRVLPPDAKPHDYSLADMAKASALLATSGPDPAYYPNTPFQILYNASPNYTFPDGGLLITANVTFNVPAGTMFYVPIFNVDDSPPVLGIFPTKQREAVPYFFDPAQLGGHDFTVVVDGHTTPVGRGYVAGPVETPPLLDGGGTDIIFIGVFLSPLSVGSHTVTIRGGFSGDLISSVYGLAFFAEEITYKVNVYSREDE